MGSNTRFKRILRWGIGFAVMVALSLVIYWYFVVNRYAGTLGFILSVPDLVSMISLPAAIFLAAASALITLELQERSERVARPLNSIHGVPEYLRRSCDILRRWKQDHLAGSAEELLIALPLIHLGIRDAMVYDDPKLKGLADEFQALVVEVLRRDEAGRVRLVTNSPFPGDAGGSPLSRFLSQIVADDPSLFGSLYKSCLDSLRRLLEERSSEVRSFSLVDDLGFVCVARTGREQTAEAVLVFRRLDEREARGLATSNPLAVQALVAVIESQLSRSSDRIDLACDVSAESAERILIRVVQHLGEAYQSTLERKDTPGVAAAASLAGLGNLAVGPDWAAVEEWHDEARLFRFVRGQDRGVAFIVLPSLSGFDRKSQTFYKLLADRLGEAGPLFALEYPGVAGFGEFSLAASGSVLKRRLEEISREYKDIHAFASCTGFAVLSRVLDDQPDYGIRRIYGWHVPEVMDFNEARRVRFERAFGLRAATDFVERFDAAGAVTSLTSRGIEVAIGGGHEVLVDEPDVRYLYRSVGDVSQRFRCGTHLPAADCPDLMAIGDSVCTFLRGGVRPVPPVRSETESRTATGKH